MNGGMDRCVSWPEQDKLKTKLCEATDLFADTIGFPAARLGSGTSDIGLKTGAETNT